MTLEDALGRPIEDLSDAIFAGVLFAPVKHGLIESNLADRYDYAFDKINRMSNIEFLEILTTALEDLKERNKL